MFVNNLTNSITPGEKLGLKFTPPVIAISNSQSKQSEDTEDKVGKRVGMVGKEEKEDCSERHWEGSGV